MANQRGALAPLHVLVVEDQADQRERLVELLREMRCRVDVATDGGMAVRRAVESSPDVVLMDLGMPGIDGWEAISFIRQRVKSAPHIIALSAFDDAGARQRAFEAGCHQYVVKPIDVRGVLGAFVARRGDRTIG